MSEQSFEKLSASVAQESGYNEEQSKVWQIARDLYSNDEVNALIEAVGRNDQGAIGQAIQKIEAEIARIQPTVDEDRSTGDYDAQRTQNRLGSRLDRLKELRAYLVQPDLFDTAE